MPRMWNCTAPRRRSGWGSGRSMRTTTTCRRRCMRRPSKPGRSRSVAGSSSASCGAAACGCPPRNGPRGSCPCCASSGGPCGRASRPEEGLLAAWFHDAVYDGVAGQDEERSAALARERLGGSLGREVARLVRLTIDHRVPRGDGAGAALVDADLGILAASPGRYQRYAAQIRREYSHVSPADWRRGRRAVLEDFRGRPHLFLTPRAKRDWGAAARRNLDWELGKLT